MATYLQGVTDYIPQFQPFQPDLNLYANILQTKQTRYDSNYKAINNIYGQYYNADLTRDSNIERKQELIKNIDFNLKRVSGLDLSLEQNVVQAAQVFKPFYEDQYLMKDMAWTKNYNSQKGRAEGLRNSQDEKMRAQYWDTGIRQLDYLREEFKEAGDDQSLSFGNVAYTPYVNTIKKAQEIAKEAGLSIETVDFSQDGRWIVTTKNGEQLTEPLSKLFEASLGSDPAIQAVYKTQAYVNRKDYAYSNAAQFGGDKNAAEMQYLENSYTMLKKQNEMRYEQLKNTSTVYDKKIADIENQIKKGAAPPQAEQFLQQLKMNKQVNDSVLSRIEKDNETLAEQEKTRETTGGFANPYGDIESLRWKVDNAMASILMEKDLDEAAEIFAYKDAKQSVQANPYAVNEQRFQFDKALAHIRGGYQMQAAKLRNEGERKTMLEKWKLESGAYGQNPETGEIELLPGYDDIFVEASNKANATDKINLKELSREGAKRQTNEYAIPYVKTMLTQLTMYKKAGIISDKKISEILGYHGKKVSLDDFEKQLAGDPDAQYKFLRGTLGTKELSGISGRFDQWVRENNNVSVVSKNMTQYNEVANKMNDYVLYLKEDQAWRQESSKMVIQKLEAQGFKNAKNLYDSNGNLRTREQFEKFMTPQEREKINKAVLNELMSPGVGARLEDAWEIVKTVGKIGWASTQGIKSTGEIGKILAKYPLEQRKRIEARLKQVGKEAGSYDGYVAAAANAYQDTQILPPPPGISALGSMSGTGIFTPGVQSVYVSPKAINTKGMAYFREFARDINKIDFGDNTKYQVSFNGATKGAMDNVKNGKDTEINSIGEKLIKDLIANANYGKTKIAPFKISAQAIAAGSPNKSAMTITPDKEWLENYLATNKDANNNMLTPERFNAILTNGITVIGDNKTFNNSLLKSTYMDPLQTYVDRNGSYTYNDTRGNGKWTIEKNKFGTSEYIMTTDYSVYDPTQNKMVDYSTGPQLVNFGNKLTAQRDLIAGNFFEDVNRININSYNGGR
jgi:hypothetical protein